MSFLFYATILLLLVSFVVFMRQVARAPEGHEDETGFHVGVSGAQRATRPATPGRRTTTTTTPGFVRVSRPSRHLAA